MPRRPDRNAWPAQSARYLALAIPLVSRYVAPESVRVRRSHDRRAPDLKTHARAHVPAGLKPGGNREQPAEWSAQVTPDPCSMGAVRAAVPAPLPSLMPSDRLLQVPRWHSLMAGA